MRPEIDMNAKCREALSLLSRRRSGIAGVEALKEEMQKELIACDQSSETGKMHHGAILLFLCGLDDLEKHEQTKDTDLRSKLFTAALRKFRSAEMQYEGAESGSID
jgi:hypothetical protein